MSIALGPLGRNGEALGSLNTSGKVAAMYVSPNLTRVVSFVDPRCALGIHTVKLADCLAACLSKALS